jgi:hypothetical protein
LVTLRTWALVYYSSSHGMVGFSSHRQNWFNCSLNNLKRKEISEILTVLFEKNLYEISTNKTVFIRSVIYLGSHCKHCGCKCFKVDSDRILKVQHFSI